MSMCKHYIPMELTSKCMLKCVVYIDVRQTVNHREKITGKTNRAGRFSMHSLTYAHVQGEQQKWRNTCAAADCGIPERQESNTHSEERALTQ